MLLNLACVQVGYQLKLLLIEASMNNLSRYTYLHINTTGGTQNRGEVIIMFFIKIYKRLVGFGLGRLGELLYVCLFVALLFTYIYIFLGGGR